MQWTDRIDGWNEKANGGMDGWNGWMEWKGERMNGRMESMFDSGMDGCLGEKRRKVSILGGFFGGVSERTKKNLKKLGKVRKS